MHARLEHLLSLRDGQPVDAAVREHTAHCGECSASLADVARLRARLRAMPSVEPPEASQWRAIRSRLTVRQSPSSRSRVAALGYAVAAAVTALACGLAWRVARAPDQVPASVAAVVTPLSAEEAIAADRVAQLQNQSAALEEALTAIGHRPAVERAGTAVPIDTLEAQVQWIDHRLSTGADDLRAAEPLWRERVEAMNSLVRLRYVEAQRIAM